jgi:hypothetical protein
MARPGGKALDSLQAEKHQLREIGSSSVAELQGCEIVHEAGESSYLPKALDEHAVAALDEAANGLTFDLDLLRTTPARDIRTQIEATVALLERMDHRALLRRQGLLSRLTGADIEARLEFELASQKVLAAAGKLREAAQNGRRILALLTETREQLAIEQTRLEQTIAAGRQLLATCPDADDFVVARFERRLANLMAMHAANVLTIEQISLAVGVLAGLLDRFTDVDTLLLPLWERSVLAMAHATGARLQREAAGEFAQCQQTLVTHLKQDAGA